jgi:hypothetical protein
LVLSEPNAAKVLEQLKDANQQGVFTGSDDYLTVYSANRG